jgi:tetratricopeptide (TPR) repeat protein
LAPQRDVVLPARVENVLVSRLDRLSVEMRRTLQAAAVLGSTFDARVLDAMLGEPTSRRLERAVSDGSLVHEGAGRFGFAQALLRDAAYEMQLRSQRRERHLASAEALLAVHAGDVPHHEVSRHFWRAGVVEASDHHLHAACVDDRRRSDTTSLLQHSAELLDRARHTGGGHYHAALTWQITALHDVQRAAEAVSLMDAELGTVHTSEAGFESALAALLEDGPAAEERRELALSWLYVSGQAGAWKGKAEAAYLALERAAVQAGDLRMAGRAAQLLADHLLWRGRVAEVGPIVARALPRLQASPRYLALVHYVAGVAELQQTRFDAARDCFQTAEAALEAKPDHRVRGGLRQALANIAAVIGPASACHAHHRATREAYRVVDYRVAIARSFANESLVWSEQGRVVEAETALAEAARANPAENQGVAVGLRHIAIGQAREAAGDLVGATEAYEAASASMREFDYVLLRMHAELRHARVLHARGRSEAGAALLEPWSSAEGAASYAHVRAQLALTHAASLASTEPVRARRMAEEAYRTVAHLSGGFLLCEALALTGRLAAAAGDAQVARTRAREARSLLPALDVVDEARVAVAVRALEDALASGVAV